MAEVVVAVNASVPGAVPVEVDPPRDAAGLLEPKPKNNDGAAIPSLLSVLGAAGAVAVPVGWLPREKVGRAVDEPFFFSSGFPSLFAVAPILPKSPPPAVAVVKAAPVATGAPRLKADWLGAEVGAAVLVP